MASGGRKRLRPVADVDSSFEDESSYQSKKFARVKNRSRIPTRTGRFGGGGGDGLASQSWAGVATSKFGGSIASVDAVGKSKVTNNRVSELRTSDGGYSSQTGNGLSSPGASDDTVIPASSRAARNSRGSSGRSSTGSHTRNSDGRRKFAKVNSGNKPKPFNWVLGSPAVKPGSNARQSKWGKTDNRSKDEVNKNRPITPRQKKKATSSHSLNTPEFMKVKDEDSIIQEKKERKRRRMKVMSLRTSKGQPLMRGRIELMLDEIKASLCNSDVADTSGESSYAHKSHRK